MKRSQSFSRYGKTLQRRHSMKNSSQMFQRAAQKYREHPLIIQKTEPKFVQSFDRVTSRDKSNTFQLCVEKKINSQAIYDVKENLIQTKSSFLPLRKQQSERLSSIMLNSQPKQNKKVCKKHQENGNNDKILTTKDLQTFRKSFHSIDFNKQTSRTHSYIKKSAVNEQSLQNDHLNKGVKMQSSRIFAKVHSFDSYLKRDFLSEKKLSIGAPSQSGNQCYKIPLDKFKVGLKYSKSHQFNRASTGRLSEPFY